MPGEGFTEPSLAGKGGSAPLPFAFPFAAGWLGPCLSTVWGRDFLPSAIACCHTAPIGNLGMRTQATRHFDRTGNLHGVLQAALFDENRDSRFATRRDL